VTLLALLHGPRALFVQAAVPPQFPHGTAVSASLLTQSEVDWVGLHILQVFVSVAPLPTNAPLIQQPVWQLPALQI
jgi:hypothetical protein